MHSEYALVVCPECKFQALLLDYDDWHPEFCLDCSYISGLPEEKDEYVYMDATALNESEYGIYLARGVEEL